MTLSLNLVIRKLLQIFNRQFTSQLFCNLGQSYSFYVGRHKISTHCRFVLKKIVTPKQILKEILLPKVVRSQVTFPTCRVRMTSQTMKSLFYQVLDLFQKTAALLVVLISSIKITTQFKLHFCLVLDSWSQVLIEWDRENPLNYPKQLPGLVREGIPGYYKFVAYSFPYKGS